MIVFGKIKYSNIGSAGVYRNDKLNLTKTWLGGGAFPAFTQLLHNTIPYLFNLRIGVDSPKWAFERPTYQTISPGTKPVPKLLGQKTFYISLWYLRRLLAKDRESRSRYLYLVRLSWYKVLTHFWRHKRLGHNKFTVRESGTFQEVYEEVNKAGSRIQLPENFTPDYMSRVVNNRPLAKMLVKFTQSDKHSYFTKGYSSPTSDHLFTKFYLRLRRKKLLFSGHPGLRSRVLHPNSSFLTSIVRKPGEPLFSKRVAGLKSSIAAFPGSVEKEELLNTLVRDRWLTAVNMHYLNLPKAEVFNHTLNTLIGGLGVPKRTLPLLRVKSLPNKKIFLNTTVPAFAKRNSIAGPLRLKKKSKMIRKKRARVRNLRKQEAERAFAAKKAAATKVEIAAENTTDVQLKPANLEQSPHAGSKIFSTIINDLKPMAMLNPHDPYWHKTQQHSKKVRGSTNTNTCLCGLNICAGGYESADHCAAMLTAGQRYGLPKRAQVRKSSRSALHNNHDILAILSPALKRVEKRPNFRILTFPGFVKPYGGMPSKLGPVNGSLKPHYVPDTTNLYPHTHPEYATLVQVKGEASGDQQPTSKRAGIPLTPLTGCLVTGAWKSNGVGITNFGRLTFTTASSTDRYKPSTAKKAPPLNHVENRNSSSFLTYARTSVFSCASGRRWPTPLDDFQADGINLRTLWTLVDPSFTANTTLAYLMCDKPLPLKRVWSAALLNHLQKFTPSEKTLDYLINLTHIANNPRGLAKGAPYLGYDYNLSHIAKSANVLPDLITGSKNYYPQTTPEKHALSQKLWEPLGLKSDRAATTMSGAGYAKTKAIISESGNTHFGIQDSVSFMQGIAVDNWGYAPVRRRKPQIPKTASPGELAAQLSDFGTNPRVGSKLFNVLWNTNTTKPKLFTRLTKTRLSTMNLHSSRAKPTKINQRIYWQKTTAPLNATDWVFQIFNTVQVDATSNVVKPPKPDIAIKWAKKVLINSTKLSQKAYRFNHKVNEKIGYGVATTYDTVLKAVKNLPEIMRKNVHATSLASAMFRLLVFKEIDEWTNHIKSWYQKHGYKTHKRIFYTFRRILNNVYATAVYSMRVIGLYFQLKGKVNSKGGMRKRTFRAFQGRFGSSTLRTIFQYKFKQVWCKTGAIGLKTIMMHRGTQYVPKYSVSNRVSGHKPKYN